MKFRLAAIKIGSLRFPARTSVVLGLLLSATAGGLFPTAAADEITARTKIEAVGGRCRRDLATANQPVVEVDLSGSSAAHTVLGLVIEFPQLTGLDVSATRIDDAGLRSVLPRLPKLRTLRARGCSIGDDTLARLGGCQELRTLDLTGTQITDAGLPHLTACKKLEELNLTGTDITDVGLASATLPHLRVLTLFATKVHGPGLLRFTTVVSLDLRATPVDDDGLHGIAALTDLEELDLSRAQVISDGLDHLRGMPKLRVLRIANTLDSYRSERPRKRLDTAPLADIPNLRELDLIDSIDVTSIASLANLTNLERLVIDENSVEFRGIEGPQLFSDIKKNIADPPQGFLRSLKNLKELQLVSCYRGNMPRSVEWLAAIGQLPALESLDLFKNSITTEGLKHLAGLKTLRRLNLIDVYGWDLDFSPLTSLTGLRTVELSYPAGRKLDFQPLTQMRRLRSVRLDAPYLSAEEKKKLLAAHPKIELIKPKSGNGYVACDCPAIPASGMSPAETCDNLWIVQAQVERSTGVHRSQAATLQILHVYSGPIELLGTTFSAGAGGAWSWNGRQSGPFKERDNDTMDGRFELGEPGIWFLGSQDGHLVVSLCELHLTAPFRAAPRDWYYPVDSFFPAKRMAEQFAPIAAAQVEDRLHLLSNAAVGDSQLMSELAVQIIARAKQPVAIAMLRKLGDQHDMPLRGQLALDESLRRLAPDSWLNSEDRQAMVLHWIQDWQKSPVPPWTRLWSDSPAVGRVTNCILADVYERQTALTDVPPLISKFLLARSIPAETRGEVLAELTHRDLLPPNARRKVLLKLIAQKADEGIRYQAACNLWGIKHLDANLKTKFASLLQREPSQRVRGMIEQYLNHRDNYADDDE